jgi:hypothetical protein
VGVYFPNEQLLLGHPFPFVSHQEEPKVLWAHSGVQGVGVDVALQSQTPHLGHPVTLA